MSRTVRSRLAAPELRAQWQRRSAASGWAFPSDWYLPAVDAVCEAMCSADTGVWAAAERLGRDRAAAGVSLAETLADVDVLVSLASSCGDTWGGDVLVRAASLGWADGAAAPTDAVVDALTGLVSADYLRVRLSEVYRAAEVEGSSAGTSHALVVIRLGRAGTGRGAPGLPMVLVGDSMRTVFAGGQSLARIGPLVAVALTERSPVLGRQARLLAEMLAAGIRVGDDPGLLPQVWIENLPPGCATAHALLSDLAR